jgi:hypothetical protein
MTRGEREAPSSKFISAPSESPTIRELSNRNAQCEPFLTGIIRHRGGTYLAGIQPYELKDQDQGASECAE